MNAYVSKNKQKNSRSIKQNRNKNFTMLAVKLGKFNDILE